MKERSAVTLGLFGLIVFLVGCAMWYKALWDNDTYKTILQAVVITGLLNMVLAFHFAANKADESRVDNTGKAFEAITATARAAGAPTEPPTVTLKPGETAQAEEETDVRNS